MPFIPDKVQPSSAGSANLTAKAKAQVGGINSGDKSKVTPWENAIGNTGIFDVPLVGGILRSMAHPVINTTAAAAELGSLLGHEATTPDKPYRVQFLSQEQQQAMNPNSPTASYGDSALQGAKAGAGVAALDVPGGGLSGGLTLKGSALAGGASGFSASDNDPTSMVRDTALNAILGPVLAKTGEVGTNFIGKTITAPGEMVFKKLPNSIRKQVELINQKLANLETSKLSDMVGYKNIQKAKEWGITADDMPEDVVTKVVPHMESLGQQLNDALSADGAAVTLNEVKDAFTRAQRQVAPGLKDVNLDDFGNRIDDFLRQNIADNMDTTPQVGGMGRNYGTGDGTAANSTYRVMGGDGGTTTPGQMENASLPLNLVNKIKMRLGERFADDPLYKQAYHNLQDLIEKKSGQADVVKGINQEYNTLREMKQAAENQMEKGLNSSVLNYDVKRKELSHRNIGDATTSTIAGLSGAAAFLPGVGPAVSAMGGTYALYRLFNNALRDPVTAQKILNVLEAPGKNKALQITGKGTKATGKAIQTLLEQAGIRLPAEMANQMVSPAGQTQQ